MFIVVWNVRYWGCILLRFYWDVDEGVFFLIYLVKSNLGIKKKIRKFKKNWYGFLKLD